MDDRKIRVLAVDHNPMLREGISVLVRLQPDMELVGAAATSDQAVRLFAEHRPQVTLMDLDLPFHAGIKAIKDIRRIDPTACIFGLLTYEWDECGHAALVAGASSILAKDKLTERLPEMLRRAGAQHYP